MKIRKGRLIDHFHLQVNELKRSENFFRAVACALSIDSFDCHYGYFLCDELFVRPTENETSKCYQSFQADDRDMVDAFYKFTIEHGARDNGGSG